MITYEDNENNNNQQKQIEINDIKNVYNLRPRNNQVIYNYDKYNKEYLYNIIQKSNLPDRNNIKHYFNKPVFIEYIKKNNIKLE